MKGQWLSQTRRLNRHYQSGGAGGAWRKLNNVPFIEVPLIELNNIKREYHYDDVYRNTQLHQNCFDVTTTIDTYDNGQYTTTTVTPNDNVILKKYSDTGASGTPAYAYNILYCNGKCGVQKLLSNSFQPQYKAKFSEHPTIRASLNISNVSFIHKQLGTGELSSRTDFEVTPGSPIEMTWAYFDPALTFSPYAICQVRFTSGPVDYTYDPIYHPVMHTGGVICYCIGDDSTLPSEFRYNGGHSFTCTIDITDFMNITPIYDAGHYVYTPDQHKVLISNYPVDFDSSYYYLYSGEYISYPNPPYYSMAADWGIVTLDPVTSGTVYQVNSGSISHYVTLDNVYERV